MISVGYDTENVENFLAGKLRNHFEFWKTLTSDKVILTQVLGCKIELGDLPEQFELPEPYSFSANKKAKIDAEVAKLLTKGVIEPTPGEKGQYVSHFHKRKIRWHFTHHFRPFRIQQVCGLQTFQNGQSCYGNQSYVPKLLHGIHRLEGCLLFCPSS